MPPSPLATTDWVRIWIAFAGLAVTLLLAGWGYSRQLEQRLTAVETKVDAIKEDTADLKADLDRLSHSLRPAPFRNAIASELK